MQEFNHVFRSHFLSVLVHVLFTSVAQSGFSRSNLFRSWFMLHGSAWPMGEHITSLSMNDGLGCALGPESTRLPKQSGNERLSCTVRLTTTPFTYRMCGLRSACVSSNCGMCAINLSYAGPNTVYCPRSTYDTVSGHNREIMPAYSHR